MAERQIQERLERLRHQVQAGRVPPQILERLERQILELRAQVEQEHIPNNTEEEKNNTNRNPTTIKRNGGYRKRKQRTKCKQHKQKHYKTYRKRKTQCKGK